MIKLILFLSLLYCSLFANGLEGMLTKGDIGNLEGKTTQIKSKNFYYTINFNEHSNNAKVTKASLSIKEGASSESYTGAINTLNSIKQGYRYSMMEKRKEEIENAKEEALRKEHETKMLPYLKFHGYPKVAPVKEDLIISFKIDPKTKDLKNFRFVEKSRFEEVNNTFYDAINEARFDYILNYPNETITLKYRLKYKR
ncbi:hypothetical protein CRV01_08550 [Arcobacter sp. CECT 8983]|uniref:hypothetical protein n=1 Tax=Arcobacter sp. CECT 8983 TaxID=2044508 RepID=UPI00100AC653|nr:hypothetical protein [Arcobacter sp. CECT 8983]RXJ89515.1 hypothetical protein CRV01_08550 [Arcobacter sp. CECT 8983]